MKSDNLNCGACGNACAAGEVCSAGSCRLSCQAGLVDCGGKCVDPMADRTHCGASGACTGAAAGEACAAGQVCSAGACALSCQAGLTDCGGVCANTQRDVQHCGACGNPCAAGQACSSGQCATSCPAGEFGCAGRCIDPSTDPLYCGAMEDCAGGVACARGQACSRGVCERLACVWTVVASHSLASLPAGAEMKQSPLGAGAFVTAYGRSAFLVTSDWSWLWIPLSLAGEVAFAVQADFFLPAATTYSRLADLAVFTDFVSTDWQIARGVQAIATADPLGASHFDWWAFTTSAGWGADGFGSPALRVPLAASVAGAWHTMRVEGSRGQGLYRSLIDGVEQVRWSSPVDATGSGLALGAWYQTTTGAYQPQDVAWSNVSVLVGDSVACVP